MKRTFAFYWQFWQSISFRFFIPLVAYLSAWLSLFLEPRTVLGEGFLPRQGWVWLLGMLLILPWLLPHSMPERFPPHLRWVSVTAIFLPIAPSLTNGIGALFCALTGMFAWGARAWSQRIALRYLEIAGTWLVISFIHNIYNYMVARIEGVPFAGYLLAPLLSLMGLSASVSGSQVLMLYEGSCYPLLVSPDKFGGAFPWLIAGATLFLGTLYCLPVRALGAVIGFITATSLAYFLWITTSWVIYDQQPAWWSESQVAFFFLPVGVLSVLVFRTHPSPQGRWEIPTSRYVAAISMLGAMLVTGGWFWVDPGVPKKGAILIDEYYSDWEWSDVKLDTRLYGVQTVYNYFCMAEFLKHYFAQVDRNYTPLTHDTLRRYSVVVLKTPTKPYPPEVIDAIRQYIAEGGGVWFIGDHTNIFGMNTYLNTVLAGWRVSLRSDAAIDPHTNRQLYLPARLAHPIVNRLPLFLYYTGCSIQAPVDLLAHDVIVMPRTLRDAPDFSQNTFFGDFAPSLAESVSPTLQAYAGYRGSGRFAIWADSTLFSNFAITLPGKMELAVGYIDFLNRRNWFPQLRLILLGIGTLLLGLGIWWGRYRLDLLCLSTWLGVLVGGVGATYSYHWFYPERLPHTPFSTVGFLEQPTSEHLPLTAPTDEEPSTSYLTAFVAALRVGKYAKVCMNLKQTAENNAIAAIHGHQIPDWQEMKQLVESGRTLVLIDGGASPEVLERACRHFGIEFERGPYAAPISIDSSPISISVAGSFLNGVPVFKDVDGRILITKKQVGRGRVYLSATKDAFCDATLGETSDIPNKGQLHLLRVLFRLYREAGEK